MRKMFSLSTVILFVILPIGFSIHHSSKESRIAEPNRPQKPQSGLSAGSIQEGPYDPNPKHIWNRLYRVFYIREGRDGQEYGQDELDPLLWPETKHLLTGPSHQRAVSLLDEFINTNASLLINDPVKRAMLQHDLWAVFDWSSSSSLDYLQERRDLQDRLARVIQQLALKPEQIQALPDTYANAVAAKVFATQYNPQQSQTAFLPSDLFQSDGPWVCLGARGGEPVAAHHAFDFPGRSGFLVFMRLPEGRTATVAYLKKLAEFPTPWIQSQQIPDILLPNPELPQFPADTQLALIRRMNVIDDKGALTPTRLTEQVQIRVHRKTSSTNPNSINPNTTSERDSQNFYEFKLSRTRFLRSGDPSGLRNVAGDEKEFSLFMSHGVDPFEMSQGTGSMAPGRRDVLNFCINCHFGPGIHSVMSFSNFSGKNVKLIPSTPDSEAKAFAYWKQSRFDWGLLQGLWRTSRQSSTR